MGRRQPLEPAEIAATVAALGRQVGLDARGAELIKFTNNAVLRLPHAGVVLRIAGSAVIGARATQVVLTAQLLSRHQVSSVRLWPGTGYPLIVRGHEITIWDDVPALRPPVAEDLAGLLRAVHAVPVQPEEVRGWDPVTGIQQRIQAAAGLARDVLDFLRAECVAVAAELLELDGVEPLLPRGLVHGDAFLGNVIVGPEGPVLCDFDSTGWGPREWDLTPVAVGARRFASGAELQRRMALGYGVDVTEWKGFRALRRLRELQLVTSVLPVLGANPALAPQWRLRLDSLRRRDTEARWTTYAEALGPG
jgi:aminoglycoside phosphotransferase (APT) family kinase protein